MFLAERYYIYVILGVPILFLSPPEGYGQSICLWVMPGHRKT